MKFAEHLGAHITPEWRKQYIHYDDMKNMLYSALEQAPSVELVDIKMTLHQRRRKRSEDVMMKTRSLGRDVRKLEGS